MQENNSISRTEQFLAENNSISRTEQFLAENNSMSRNRAVLIRIITKISKKKAVLCRRKTK